MASNISNNEINEVYRNSKPNDKNLVYEKEKLDCPNNIRKYAQSSRGVDYLTRWWAITVLKLNQGSGTWILSPI